MRLVSISPATLLAAFLAAACTTTTASYAATDHARVNHAAAGVGDACSAGCLRFFPEPGDQATCEQVCSAVEAQSDTPCGQALLGSSLEHLTLLSYSSGHVLESLAILLGSFGGNSSTAEDVAFFSDLHLNDRGSPQACGDVEDAHYCIGQLPVVASIGVCLPQSCDSASVLALLASVNASSLLPSSTGSDGDATRSAASMAGSASFTCGDELRIYPDAGTVSVLAFLGVLVALVVAGTALDYRHRCHRRSRQAEKQQLQHFHHQQQHQQHHQQQQQHHQQQQQQSIDNGNNSVAAGAGRTPLSSGSGSSTWTRNTLLHPNDKHGRSNAAATTTTTTISTTWATNGVEEGKDIGPHEQQQQQQHHHHHQQQEMERGGEEAVGHSNTRIGRGSLEHGEDLAREPLLPSSSSSSSRGFAPSLRVRRNQNPAHFRDNSNSSSPPPPSRPSNNFRGLNELSIAGESGDSHNNNNNSERRDGQNADMDSKKSARWWQEGLECFSLMLNMDRLAAPPRAGNEFGALDGVRTLSMMWVVLGHVLVYALSGPGFTNTIDVVPRHGEGLLARLTAQVLPGGFLAVDTFFLMSGFLLSSVLLPKLASGSLGRWRWVAKAYLHRYLRLTPTLAFTTFFVWKVLPLLGEGPGWWPLATGQADRCRRYWWVEITYLSNVIPWPPLATGCLGVSWYVSNDTMFFVAGVPLVALYHKRPRAGVVAAFAIIAASCGYTLLWLGFREDVRFSLFNAVNGNGWVEAYSSPWARCPVYLIGLLCGFAWHSNFRDRVVGRGEAATTAAGVGNDDSANPAAAAAASALTRRRVVESGEKEEEEEEGFLLRHSKTAAAAAPAVAAAAPAIAAIASAALLALPVYGSYWAYQDVAETGVSPWADHLYLAFSRPAWALGVALMCALCFLGRGGFVEWVLTRPSWATPSRLSYCAYLTHPWVLTVMYGWRESAVRLTWVELSVTYMGVVVGTFAGATALHLVVEAPFRNLESWARRSWSAGGARKRQAALSD